MELNILFVLQPIKYGYSITRDITANYVDSAFWLRDCLGLW